MKKTIISFLAVLALAHFAQAAWYGFKGSATSPSYWDVKENWYITGGGTWEKFTSGSGLVNVHINKNAGGKNNPGFTTGWDNTITFQSKWTALTTTLRFCAGTTSDPIKFVATSESNGLESTADLWVKDDTDNKYGSSYQTPAPCLEIQSGTYSFNGFNIGNNANKTCTFVMTGGALSTSGDLILGKTAGIGILTINGGTVSVSSGKWTKSNGGTGTINLNGGTLVTKHIRDASGRLAVNFNGGTLKANDAYGAGLLYTANNKLTVTVGASGGTIDTGNFDIAVPVALTAVSGTTGFFRFTGGGSVTLTNAAPTYAGKTFVAAGTKIVVTRAIAESIVSHGLELDGIPELNTHYTILSSPDDLSGLDLSKVTCGLDGTYTAALGADQKSIVVTCTSIPALYIGPADGSLSEAANWSGGVVPTSGSAFIHCASTANLVKGDDFAPSSITFTYESASVTISGDGEITGIAAITNYSPNSHTINVPVRFAGDIQVRQNAMADTGDLAKSHITFAGGAYAAQGCAIENDNSDAVYSRCMFGKYHLNPAENSRWSVPNYGPTKRLCLADNSELHIPYAGKLTELYVGRGAKVFVGDMALNGRLMYQMGAGGEMVITNLTATGNDNRTVSYWQGTSTPGVFKFDSVVNSLTGSDNRLRFADSDGASKHVFYIGKGGLNFLNAHVNACYHIGRDANSSNVETIRPWYSDFTIAQGANRASSDCDVVLNSVVEFCTSDEHGTGRTITLDAVTRAGDNAAIFASGNGTLRVNKASNNYAQPSVTVKDTATLAYAPGASLTTSNTTVNAGATLAVAASGMVTLGGSLVLKNNACLGFNWTSRTTPTLDLTGKTVTFDTGATTNVTVRISAVDGKRARSGKNVLTSSGGAFAGVDVSLADGAPEWARGVSVENGEIVLEGRCGTNIILR